MPCETANSCCVTVRRDPERHISPSHLLWKPCVRNRFEKLCWFVRRWKPVRKLGFLPGDMFAKVNPFLRPLLDAIHDMLDQEQVRRYLANDVIEIVPLAFMRGRTLNDTFMILDEAQNTTCTQMKMFLTRMGLNSRIVVTGDSTQIDLEKGVESGLKDGITAAFSYTWGCDCSPEWTGYCPPSTGSRDCFGVRNCG